MTKEFVFRHSSRLTFSFLIISTLLVACFTKDTSTFPTSTSIQETALPANSIRLANGEWPPYNSTNLPHGGCDSWVVEESFALQGINVEYEFFPWARSYILSSTGVFDGTLAWADTPEHRDQHFISQEPTTIQEWVFFFRTDQPFVYSSMADLEGKTVGITAGYVYSDAFIDLQDDDTIQFIASSSDEANFQMLLAGRIDVFPMERNVGLLLISSLFSEDEQNQISLTPNSFAQFQTHLLLSKAVESNRERMGLFNTGFQQLKESGRYDQILQQCKTQYSQ